MSEKHDDFIKEKVIKEGKKERIKNIIKKIVKIIIAGAIFGMVAGFCFIIIVQNYKFDNIKQESTNNQEVVIPKDDVREDNEIKEPVENIVQSVIENYEYSTDTLDLIYNSLADVSSQAEKSIVSVQTVVNETDLFNNNIELHGANAGIVIAENDYEYIIAYITKDNQKKDTFKVRISDGSEYNGELKRYDRISGINVISIKKQDMDDNHKSAIKAIVLGNSYQVNKGDYAIVIGSPLGMMRSINYGIVSFIAKNVGITDGYARFLYTNINSNPDKGSYLINSKGELIGIATAGFDFLPDGNKFIGISDIKTLLERMSNSKSSPYMGISTNIIDEGLSEKLNMPIGLYITSIKNDSPAYLKGIKQGDVIISMDNRQIKTLSDYKNVLDYAHVDDSIKIVIMRKSKNGYKKMEYNVSVISR